MYEFVPMTTPEAVRPRTAVGTLLTVWVGRSMSFASPKSMILTCPS